MSYDTEKTESEEWQEIRETLTAWVSLGYPAVPAQSNNTTTVQSSPAGTTSQQSQHQTATASTTTSTAGGIDPTKQVTPGYEYDWQPPYQKHVQSVQILAEIKDPVLVNKMWTAVQGSLGFTIKDANALDLSTARLFNPSLVPNPDWNEVERWARNNNPNMTTYKLWQPTYVPFKVAADLEDKINSMWDSEAIKVADEPQCFCDSRQLAVWGHAAGCDYKKD